MSKRILRTPEAAEYLGISVSYLEKLRGRGVGPRVIRLGDRALGYDVQELDRWIDGRYRENTGSEDLAR